MDLSFGKQENSVKKCWLKKCQKCPFIIDIPKKMTTLINTYSRQHKWVCNRAYQIQKRSKIPFTEKRSDTEFGKELFNASKGIKLLI